MNTYSGSMSIYFPCKVKSGFPISRLNDRWNRWRKRQIDFIHHSRAPLTDLMDKKKNRFINESLLKVFQKTLVPDLPFDNQCAPYGLKCLQLAYRKRRESSIFSKNIQILLSSFNLEYYLKNKEKTLKSEGALLLNVNADNSVATLIVVLNFSDYQAIDLIYLKHIFYKRLLVCITEKETEMQNCNCANCTWMGCRKKTSEIPLIEMTMQDFMNMKIREISFLNKLEYDFDYRARYSFVELANPLDKFVNNQDEYSKLQKFKQKRNAILLEELYGILYADECYVNYPFRKLFDIFKTNNSTRIDYDLYVSGLNALIIRNRLSGIKSSAIQLQEDFIKGYNEHNENIRTEQINGSCIPGLQEGRFPSFLKAVEIHYLINKVTTNEIAIHERSFLNPVIIFKRLWLLWEILYDVDSHKYHVNNNFQREFGILKQLDDIRNEYNGLLTHSMSYSMAIVTIIATFITFIQLWK